MAKSSDLQVDLLPGAVARPVQPWKLLFWQIIRFGIVGVCNASIDFLTLNLLLFCLPTHNANLLLVYNTGAYTLGALNSYVCNKYWTFRHKQAMTRSEVLRFAILNVVGVLCNDLIIWTVARLLHPLIANAVLWANAAKLSAVIGTAIVSYVGMRLWVFTSTSQKRGKRQAISSLVAGGRTGQAGIKKYGLRTKRSLSVILPAYNEERQEQNLL